LNKGDIVLLTLGFKDADGKITKQEVNAVVRDLTAAMDAQHKAK
jgi:hypothetical protein